MKGTQYIALYDFSADQPHQLSIKSGDIVSYTHYHFTSNTNSICSNLVDCIFEVTVLIVCS